MSSATSELVQDTLDNLELLESTLLEAEKSIKSGHSCSALVHIMFRYAHNTKGALGILGEMKAQGLMHHLETSLDAVRNGKQTLSVDAIDRYLQAISTLQDYLNSERDEHYLESQIAALEPVLAAHETVPPPSSAGKLPAAVQHRVDAGLTEGSHLYRIEKIIATSISESDYNNLPILEDVKAVGELVHRQPTFKAISRKREEELLELFVLSEKTPEEFGTFIFDSYFHLAGKIPQKAPTCNSHQGESLPTAIIHNELRMLVVEDEMISRRLLVKSLAAVADVDEASSGREGILSYLLSLEEHCPYQAIFLDIDMPEMDGHKMLKLVRRIEAERSLALQHSAKIIMVTGATDSQSILGSFREGCEAYLTKPLSYQKLVATLQKLQLPISSNPNPLRTDR